MNTHLKITIAALAVGLGFVALPASAQDAGFRSDGTAGTLHLFGPRIEPEEPSAGLVGGFAGGRRDLTATSRLGPGTFTSGRSGLAPRHHRRTDR